ncbi:MAG: response regulator [Nanoarchaeota archaeon]
MDKVLLVDDDQMLGTMLDNFLKDKYKLKIALSIEEAETMMMEFCPQVILLDLNFNEGKDGRQFLQSGNANGSIVIVISAETIKTEEKVKFLNKGALDVIKKPFELLELEAKINKAISLYNAYHSLDYKNISDNNLGDILDSCRAILKKSMTYSKNSAIIKEKEIVNI